MPILIFYNPNNPKQQYMTTSFSDAGIPSGWIYSQGSDGAIPAALQVYRAGVNNQGAGSQPSAQPSNGDPNQITAQPRWPNGLLGAQSGNSVIEPGT
jgi:hypothetical protein